jgi:hypothetical protein
MVWILLRQMANLKKTIPSFVLCIICTNVSLSRIKFN